MLFKTKCTIRVTPGHGGNGSATTAFGKRQSTLYCGGNGGNGGDIIFQLCEKITSLDHIHAAENQKAQDGKPGANWWKTGKRGESLIIKVPNNCFISIKGKKDEIFTMTINKENTSYKIKGGRGGYGSQFLRKKDAEASLGQMRSTFTVRLSIEVVFKAIFFCTKGREMVKDVAKKLFNIECMSREYVITKDFLVIDGCRVQDEIKSENKILIHSEQEIDEIKKLFNL